MSDNPVQTAVARLAAALRSDREMDPVRIAERRNALVAARLERAISRALTPEDSDYEPLRSEDRKRLAAILKG